MPPKRKAVVLEDDKPVKVVEDVEVDDDDDEEEDKPKAKKQKSKAKEGNVKSKKTPTTMKEKILHLLAKQEKLIGLVTIKKILKEEYDVEDNKANNTRITKTLKDLSEEERDDFGKIGGSYHGGDNSVAYQEYAEKEAQKEARRQFLELHKDELQCPHCETWNDEMACWLGEDSVARGGKYRCKDCNKLFYTWISDYDTRVGHKIEYRYGDGKGDYGRNS